MLGRAPGQDRFALGAGILFDMAAKADLIGAFAPLEFPRIAVCQPVLGQLDLPPLAHFLAEQAMGIANAIAIGRDLEAGHGFEETGGKAPEAAIAQRRIRLEPDEVAKVDTERFERFAHRLELLQHAVPA